MLAVLPEPRTRVITEKEAKQLPVCLRSGPGESALDRTYDFKFLSAAKKRNSLDLTHIGEVTVRVWRSSVQPGVERLETGDQELSGTQGVCLSKGRLALLQGPWPPSLCPPDTASFSPPLLLHCPACSFGPMKLAFCFSYLQPVSCRFCIPELGLLAENHAGHWPLSRATCMVLQTECLCLPEFMVEFYCPVDGIGRGLWVDEVMRVELS